MARSRRTSCTLGTLALVGGLLAMVTPAAGAATAGEKFEVNSIASAACGGMSFNVTITQPDAGNHLYRTVVTSAGKTYMVQNFTTDFSPSISGTWTLGDIKDEPVANPGTWPLTSGEQVRADFEVRHPGEDTALWKWSTVLESCESGPGTVLYNGKTDDDRDRDLIAVPTDRCPKAAEPDRANGCPLVDRSLSLVFRTQSGEFAGRLKAPGARALASRQKVSVFRVLRGPDRKVASTRTNRRGKYVAPANPRAGRYYAKARGVIKPAVGQSRKVRSNTIILSKLG